MLTRAVVFIITTPFIKYNTMIKSLHVKKTYKFLCQLKQPDKHFHPYLIVLCKTKAYVEGFACKKKKVLRTD